MTDIERTIDRLNWVSSYEIFIQTIEQIIGETSKYNNLNLMKRQRKGITVRVISKSKKLQELSLGFSLLDKIATLSEPKSTAGDSPKLTFKPIKFPRITSIQGDQGSSLDLTKELVEDLLDRIKFTVYESKIEVNHRVNLEKETLWISNLGSKPLNGISLRFRYNSNAKLTKHGEQFSVNRAAASRNLAVNFEKVIEEAEKGVKKQSMKTVKLTSEKTSIIIHPEIIGRIIMLYSSDKFLKTPSKLNQVNQVWDENIQLYDDPLRIDGYGSFLFDDEGSLTQPRQLLENGFHTGGLHNMFNSNWKNGGNGFRTSWYQPILRSYQFPIKLNITNLVVVGGTGKGKKFIERSGTSLLVLRGYGYISGDIKDPQFIIHSSETEVWRNGKFIGPTENLTFYGSVDQIMKKGDLSSDQYQVVDNVISGAIYIGYLHASNDLIQYRRNK